MLSRRELTAAGVAGGLAPASAGAHTTTAALAEQPADREGQKDIARQLENVDSTLRNAFLTSSVAHDIRNPLAGIAAGIDYLGRGIPADDPKHGHLAYVTREVRRLDRIVSDLSVATRPREPQRQALKIEVLIQEALRAIESRPEAAETRFELALAADLPPALADPDQLSQVLLNLIFNGCDAMAGLPRDERRLRVTTAVERGGVTARVVDRGTGILHADMERIFQPFVTTKSDGLGLGLVIARSIVDEHFGTIEAENGAEGGAIFRVRLPSSA